MLNIFSETQKNDTLFVLFGLSCVVFGWLMLALTVSSLFLFPLVALGAALIGALAVFIGGRLAVCAPRDIRLAFLALLIYAALVGYFSDPTLFSGRDQGSISEAAFRLAENGRLAFASPASKVFFDIYGPGTALNFPGFAYTEDGYLITQFPLGYTAWIAGFISLFGMLGPTIGNMVLLFLFLFTFYSLLRLFVHPWYAFSGLALAAFSFLPTWFAKITLSENLAVFLFTFLAFNLILFRREGKFIFYAGVFLSAGLLAFTRIEGFAFFVLAFIIMAWSKPARDIWKTYPLKSLVIPGMFLAFFSLRDLFINLPYYKMIGKALLKFLNQLGGGSITGDLAGTGGSLTLGSIFFLYGLLIIFVVGLFGILLFIKEKRSVLLLPALLALPTFIYLFDPNISLDHPWMLRRYLFSLFPTLLFSAVVGIALLFAKEKSLPIAAPQGKRLFFAGTIFLGLLVLQYPAWSYALPLAENRLLLEQVSRFSEEFSDRDLVLVDRFATGDGFAMLSGPAQFLFGKNMVYFFNPHDLEALDTGAFEHTYLLVPEGDQARYADVFGDRLVFRKTITFSREQLESLSLEDGALLRLPEKMHTETRNLLFEIY